MNGVSIHLQPVIQLFKEEPKYNLHTINKNM